MASWHDILEEVKQSNGDYDSIRRKYLSDMSRFTGRNTVVYYSGWLQKPDIGGVEVNDSDKNGFMAVIHKLDRSTGLDLVLHTPGGETAATESLIDYLRSMFDADIRVFIPQLAMSAGTMIACAAKVIFMGKHSSLGPIDPQFRGTPAHGIIEEFNRAHSEIKDDPAKIAVWQPIIAKYPPAFVGECEKAIRWSEQIVRDCLRTAMYKADNKAVAKRKIDKVLSELGDHALNLSHSRHISAAKCKEIELNIEMLEDDQELQEKVLSVHHACIHTLAGTAAFKLIENHEGKAFVQQVHQHIAPQVQFPAPMPIRRR